MLKILERKGQSGLEYSILLIIVIAALLSMQMYFKRGVQGRMRASIDGVGEQYDPMTTESDITQNVMGTTFTTIRVQNVSGGKETIRDDNTNMTEKKNGYTRVDAY